MTKSGNKEVTFEAGMGRLEELIEELEQGDLDLDKSLALFEEGVKLTRRLNMKLDEAEKRLELLIKDESGRRTVKDFDLDSEEMGDD